MTYLALSIKGLESGGFDKLIFGFYYRENREGHKWSRFSRSIPNKNISLSLLRFYLVRSSTYNQTKTNMWKEFKEFALSGSLIDTAIAFVMGAAFGKVVTAFVEKMFAPVVGLLLGGINLADKKWVLKAAEGDAPEVAIAWGAFITASIDFLVVAFIMFLVIKGINASKRKAVEAAPAAPAGPTDIELLGEIRDLLKK
jgi:large conductance mechanosensitive channel